MSQIRIRQSKVGSRARSALAALPSVYRSDYVLNRVPDRERYAEAIAVSHFLSRSRFVHAAPPRIRQFE